MNNFTAPVIVGWQTRNIRRHEKAIIWCRDYGLKLILPTVYIGNLYSKEEKVLVNKFKKEFTRKTEKILLVKLCQSCYASIDIEEIVKQKVDMVYDFELIQIPTEWEENIKNKKKPRK